MAGFQQAKPLGLDWVAASEGISTGAGGSLPSSVGLGADPTTDSLDVRGTAVLGEQSRAESMDLTFPVASQLYRLRRPSALWNSMYYEEPLRTEESRAILARAVEQHSDNAALVRLLTLAATRLSWIDAETSLVLMRLRLRDQPTAAPRPYVPPPPRSAPAPAAPPPAEEPAISPAIGAAQAAALKEAAGMGVPFCEECARAAAREAALASAS